ncbi:hypothetical protein M9H77_07207 [Catharanthus roseus]|uniref:Uncharacterized protein n=1 Tax=Catharanthus roseus TaxID=4058 RepID=A0ACC0BUI8_CATRO|nr:hypothetical protein M9H77_07207 [Catharanthus roseus]
MMNTIEAMIMVLMLIKDITLVLTVRMIVMDSGGVEDRRSMEKELGSILEHLSIGLSLNPSSLYYEISLEELKSLLDSYTFQVSLIGDMFIISFEGNIFLLMPSMTNFLSSHFSLGAPLMSSSVMFDPSCYGFGNLDDTSLVGLNIVGFVFEFDSNSLQLVCTITSTRGRRHTMEFEGQGENVGGKLIYRDLTMSFSSNLSSSTLCFPSKS